MWSLSAIITRKWPFLQGCRPFSWLQMGCTHTPVASIEMQNAVARACSRMALTTVAPSASPTRCFQRDSVPLSMRKPSRVKESSSLNRGSPLPTLSWITFVAGQPALGQALLQLHVARQQLRHEPHDLLVLALGQQPAQHVEHRAARFSRGRLGRAVLGAPGAHGSCESYASRPRTQALAIRTASCARRRAAPNVAPRVSALHRCLRAACSARARRSRPPLRHRAGARQK